MASTEHWDILIKGIAGWNKWRRHDRLAHPDLSGANLSGRENMAYVNLSRANLSGANLSRANLMDANLSHANLRGTLLLYSHLIDVDLSDADLSDANLNGAQLSLAKLRRTNLSRADLSGTVFESTILSDTDLSEVKGLETIRNLGPSTIGLDTFFKSKGKIPESFLRGAVVPDIFIKYAASLAGAPFYSCFISHSTKDVEFVEQLHADLQSKGVRCWYAPEDLKIGDKFRFEFDRAIRLYEKLLIVLSEHSVQSNWVETEVETAFEMERQEKRLVLFPIRLDNAVNDIDAGWAAYIKRTRHIGDFRNWKD